MAEAISPWPPATKALLQAIQETREALAADTEIGSSRLDYHPIPTPVQERALFCNWRLAKEGPASAACTANASILQDEEFAASILGQEEAERSKWLYVLATRTTLLEVIVSCYYRLLSEATDEHKYLLLPRTVLFTLAEEGLQTAIDTYDLDRGWRFTTMAMWSIRACIQERAKEHNRPSALQHGLRVLQRFVGSYRKLYYAMPSPEEVRLQMFVNANGKDGIQDVSPAVIDEAILLWSGLPTRYSTTELPKTGLADAQTTEEIVERAELVALIRNAVYTLGPWHRYLIYALYGLDGRPELPLKAAAAQLGIDDEETAERLQAEALAFLGGHQAVRFLGAAYNFPDPVSPASIRAAGNTPGADAAEAIPSVRDGSILAKVAALAQRGMDFDAIVKAMGYTKHKQKRVLSTKLGQLARRGVIPAWPPLHNPKHEQVLADRQQVYALRVAGKTHKQIAEVLGKNENTILKHVRALQAEGLLPKANYTLQERLLAATPKTRELRDWMIANPPIPKRRLRPAD